MFRKKNSVFLLDEPVRLNIMPRKMFKEYQNFHHLFGAVVHFFEHSAKFERWSVLLLLSLAFLIFPGCDDINRV